MSKRIADLEQGNKFKDKEGVTCMVTESTLMMGEIPYVRLEGDNVGSLSYYEDDEFNDEVEIVS